MLADIVLAMEGTPYWLNWLKAQIRLDYPDILEHHWPKIIAAAMEKEHQGVQAMKYAALKKIKKMGYK